MPYYFATPRAGMQVIQKRQETGRLEYNRTAATSVLHVSETRIDRPLRHAINNLHGIVLSRRSDVMDVGPE